MSKLYDVIVIGGGPAGLSAALYAGRARLNTLVIEKKKEGGQIALTSEVENYPGCLEGESGPTLIDRMHKQVLNFGAEVVYDEIESVFLEGSIKQLRGKKDVYKAKTIISYRSFIKTDRLCRRKRIYRKRCFILCYM